MRINRIKGYRFTLKKNIDIPNVIKRYSLSCITSNVSTYSTNFHEIHSKSIFLEESNQQELSSTMNSFITQTVKLKVENTKE